MPQFNAPQDRVRRLLSSVLPMLSQGLVEEAEHVGMQFGMSSRQPRLQFDDDGETLF